MFIIISLIYFLLIYSKTWSSVYKSLPLPPSKGGNHSNIIYVLNYIFRVTIQGETRIIYPSRFF
jgi:hypothetical protein